MIGNAVNGGLVMATALRALGEHLAADPTETTEHVDPVVLSAYFMTASQPGPVHRDDRGHALRPQALHGADDDPPDRTTTGSPSSGCAPSARSATSPTSTCSARRRPPEMPPPEQCVSAEQAPPDFLANAKFLERLDLRLDPSTAGWALGKPSMRGVMRGWLRLRDGREPDTTMLMMALDALPPVAFDLGPLRLDADARVHRPRAPSARAGLAAGLPRQRHARRRDDGGGRHDLGLRRQPRRPVAPALRRAAARATSRRRVTVELVYETHSITEDNEPASRPAGSPGGSPSGRRLAVELGSGVAEGSRPSTPPTSPRRRDRRAGLRRQRRAPACRRPAPRVRLRHAQRVPRRRPRPRALDHVDVPFPGGQSYRDVVDATAASCATCAATTTGERVLVIAHSANRWALQHLLDGAPLEQLVSAPFDWQPGWEWTLA